MKNCPSCGESVSTATGECEKCGAPLDAPRYSVVRRVGYIGFFVMVLSVLVIGLGTFVAWIHLSGYEQEELVPGDDIVRVIGPETPMGMADKPYVDYNLVIPAFGTYELSLESEDTRRFDPYLSLLRNNQMIAADNDSGNDRNAMIRHTLRPGSYSLRVTSHDIGELEQPVEYYLSVQRVPRSTAARW